MLSNTGGVNGAESFVRVYGPDGNLIGAVSPSSRNPLLYLRKHPKSRYTHQLKQILLGAGATQEEISQILEISA